MGNTATPDLKVETRSTGQQELQSSIDKGVEMRGAAKTLGLTTLGEFEKPTGTPTTIHEEITHRLKLALHRDVHYMAAGNLHLRRLAFHQDFRALYEGAKISADSGEE